MNRLIDKLKDALFGTSSALGSPITSPVWNRKARRTAAAMRLKSLAAPKRLKFEKRGAPGRASKGRKPLRAS